MWSSSLLPDHRVSRPHYRSKNQADGSMALPLVSPYLQPAAALASESALPGTRSHFHLRVQQVPLILLILLTTHTMPSSKLTESNFPSGGVDWP